MDKTTAIPASGVDKDELLEMMQSFRSDDADWKGGRTFSMVYYAGDAHHDFLKKAHNLYFAENGLNPIAFKSLKRFEAEVVRMAASMLHGDGETVGTMTSGGTESLLLAVKSYRDRAKRTKPWIISPEIVAPKSIHVAFDKAAHYFGVKMRYVELGDDFRSDLKAIKKAVGRNTIAIAVSAAQYPQGVVDRVEEVAEFALSRKLPLHVDACIGGFMLPWVEKLGYEVPLWDFRVPGVTSISADVHKYGYASKGASVIVYRDMSYLKHQFFVSTNWPGGIYASPSMPGTRPGGPIAAAWAAMMAMGEEGYMALADSAMKASRKLIEGIEAIPELTVNGEPHMTIVTYSSVEPAVDIYAVADQLEERGWSVDRQQFPASIHCTLNANHLEIIEDYLEDLKASVEHIKANPGLESEGNAAMYGMMAKVPVRALVKYSVQKVMEGMYGPTGEVPDLSTLGEGEDDPMVLKLITKYGDQAMGMLDKLTGARDILQSYVDKASGLLRK